MSSGKVTGRDAMSQEAYAKVVHNQSKKVFWRAAANASFLFETPSIWLHVRSRQIQDMTQLINLNIFSWENALV